MNDILARIWNLRTHPFQPCCDWDGLEIDPRITQNSLDPQREPRLLRFYFDGYGWENSQFIKNLSDDQIFHKFPDIDQLVMNNETLLVLLSGHQYTGKRSLQNRILYAIKRKVKDAIVIRTKIGSQSSDSILSSLARRIIRDITHQEPKIDKDALKDIYQEEYKELERDLNAYSNLFEGIRDIVREKTDRPIVLIPEEANHYQVWESIFDATEGLVNIIIVKTSRDSFANTCASSLRLKDKNATHIRAYRLDLKATREFLKKRLEILRLEPQPNEGLPDITPFTDDALAALFEMGSKPDNRRIDFNLRELNRRFCEAVDGQIRALEEEVERNGFPGLETLDAQKFLINPDRIYEACDQANRGD